MKRKTFDCVYNFYKHCCRLLFNETKEYKAVTSTLLAARLRSKNPRRCLASRKPVLYIGASHWGYTSIIGWSYSNVQPRMSRIPRKSINGIIRLPLLFVYRQEKIFQTCKFLNTNKISQYVSIWRPPLYVNSSFSNKVIFNYGNWGGVSLHVLRPGKFKLMLMKEPVAWFIVDFAKWKIGTLRYAKVVPVLMW